MNKITDERKQILKSALFEKGATKKFLADIDDIQELIFLITLLNECSEKNTGFNIEDSRELIYKHLISKIAVLEKCFILTDNFTGGPLISQNYADIYSCCDFADEAVKYFSSIGIECSVTESDKINMNIFEYLYYMGIKYLRIDYSPSSYNISVLRSEILSKSKIKKSGCTDCDTDNPALRFAISNFYCSMHYRKILGIDDRKIENLQNIMTYQTAHAKYLVPVKPNPENPEKFTMAKTVIKNQGEMLTVFTDKPEFDKAYPEGWEYLILDLNSVAECAVSGKCNGIVINVMSERLSINRNAINKIIKDAQNMILKS